MKRKGIVLASLALSAVLAITGCSSEPQESKTLAQIQEKHPAIIKNEGDPIDAQILKVAVVSDSPFKGIFNPFFYTDGIDFDFMEHTMAGAFPTGDDFKVICDSDDTPIKVHTDLENKTLTYKINPKFKWSNGDPFVVDDIIKTYEIVANETFIESSQSPRYSEQMEIIEGMKEYHDGKADHISGLEKIADDEMVIHFNKMIPSIAYGTDCIAGDFIKASDFENVPMDKVISCDAMTKNPKSYGPYYITKVIAGESVRFKANPYYYKGEAKIKEIDFKILPTSQQVADMQAGGHDIYIDSSADAYEQMSALDNIKIASRPELYMSYLGFKQGTFEDGEVHFNPDAKMSNVALKRAMGMAIDNDKLGEKYYHGLRFGASSSIAPQFKDLRNPDIEGFKFDLEEANKILDEAGFKDVDGDGLREDPNGEPLEIHLAMMSGGEIAEPLSQYYLQQWGKGESGDGTDGLGLNVSLVDDRLLDFHVFYDRIMADDPDVDVFAGAWGLSSNPDPTGLYGKSEMFNLYRFTSPELQGALDKIQSEDAFDAKKNEEFYHEFDKVFFEQIPCIPLQFKVEMLPINNRVKYYDMTYNKNTFDWSMLELTAENPIGK